MKKRIILTAALLMIAISFAFASSVEVTGWGSTPEKARANAEDALHEFIEARVTTVVESTDGETDAISVSEFQSGKAAMDKAVYSEAVLKDGEWSVKATLPESLIEGFTVKAEALAAVLRNADPDKKASDTELMFYFSDLIAAYDEYTSYAKVLLRMTDGNWKIEDFSQTAGAVTARYTAAINRRTASISTLIKEMRSRTGSDPEKLDELMDEQRKLDALLSELASRHFSAITDYTERLERQNQRFIDDLMKARSEMEGNDYSFENPGEMIALIAQYTDSFSGIKRKLSENLVDVFDLFKEEASRLSYGVYSRELSPIETGADGLPKAPALQIRIEEVTKLIEEIYPKYYRTARDIYDDIYSLLRNNLDEIDKLLSMLEGTKYTVSTLDGTLSVRIDDFSIESGIWHGTASFNLLEKEIELPFTIPYMVWMKKPVPTAGSDRWEEYTAECEYLNTIFTTKAAYDVTVTYSLEADKQTNSYMLHPENIKVSDPVGKRAAVWQKNNLPPVKVYALGNRIDMTDLSMPNVFGITGPRAIYTKHVREPEAPVIREPEPPVRHPAEVFPEEAEPPHYTKEVKIYESMVGQKFELGLGVDSLIRNGYSSVGVDVNGTYITPEPVFRNTHLGLSFDFGYYPTLFDFEGSTEEDVISGMLIGLETEIHTRISSDVIVVYGLGVGTTLNKYTSSIDLPFHLGFAMEYGASLRAELLGRVGFDPAGQAPATFTYGMRLSFRLLMDFD